MITLRVSLALCVTMTACGGGGAPGDAGRDGARDGEPGDGATDAATPCWSVAASMDAPPDACPTVLDDALLEVPTSLVVDETTLYWTEQEQGVSGEGDVASCPKSGCGGNPTMLATFQKFPTAITVDATNVYWIVPGAVLSCAKGGCGGNPTALVSGSMLSVLSIASDGTNVYLSSNQGIGFCAATGCNNTPTILASPSVAPNPLFLAVDGTTVYWTENGVVPNGTVMSCPKSGCGDAAVTLATGLMPQLIVVNASGVYWNAPNQSGNTGAIWTCAKTGCNGTPTMLANTDEVFGLAANDTNVFWTQANNVFGSIVRCAAGGCSNSPTTMIDVGATRPDSPSLDQTNIYWFDQYVPAQILTVPQE